MRLHPTWTNRRVKVFPVEGPELLVVPNGLGKSEGPGTFRRYLEQDMVKVLRFHAAKDFKQPAERR